MKAQRNLGLAAVVVFVISHFLPAYGELSGFGCFLHCWEVLLDGDEILSGGWLYYSGLAVANILFIGLVVALLVNKGRTLRTVLSVVMFLHVLSWFALHFFSTAGLRSGKIQIGYYVWLMAFGLLVAAHLWKERDESLESIPLPA